MNLPVDFVAVGILSVIAGSGHHDDTRVDQCASGAANRIVLVGIDSRSTQAHIYYANAVLIFVQRVAGTGRLRRIGRSENPVQGTQQNGDGTGALLIQHAQVDDVRVWRNALISIAGGSADSRSGARDVATVS